MITRRALSGIARSLRGSTQRPQPLTRPLSRPVAVPTTSLPLFSRQISSLQSPGLSVTLVDSFKTCQVGRRRRIASGCQQQTRSFARPSRPGENANANRTLANEHLVKALMAKHAGGRSAEDVQVRMITEIQGQSSSSVVSLKTAIQTAVENDRDLVEVALQQDIPVVKVIALSSLAYQSKKKKQTTNLPVKEIQVKAGIANSDLLRKMTQLIGYLEKGHRVSIRIRGTRKAFTRNPNAVVDTLEEILQMVRSDEVGETVNPPDFNEQRTQVQVLLKATPPK